MKKFTINLLSALFWIGIWEVIYLCVDKNFLLASPLAVAQNLVILLTKKSTYYIMLMSLLRILTGFLAAIVIGCLFAYVSFRVKPLRPLIEILFKIIKLSPIVSFIILALVYVPEWIIVPLISFLMVTPVFYYSTLSSLRNVDKKMIEMARMYDFTPFQKLKYIYINSGRKAFIGAIETGIGFAFKSGITAEVLVLPKVSFGMMLYTSKIYLDGLNLASYTILLIILAILVEKLVIFFAKKVTEPWQK